MNVKMCYRQKINRTVVIWITYDFYIIINLIRIMRYYNNFILNFTKFVQNVLL